MKKLLPLLIIPFLVFSSCKKDKPGCTDPAACNYDENANKNDGTCIAPTTWYQDLDGDTLGNPYETLISCTKPTGYVSNNADTSGSLDLLVVKRQRATVTYVGATWCPPCGAYGDPTKEHMESTFGSDVVILNVQSVDVISSAGEFGPTFGSAFQSFVGSSSIPHAYWSGANVAMDHRGFYSSNSANATAADANINAILSDDNVSVGVAASATISGSTVTVETLTKFYSNLGEHYIGVYLLEDNVMADQQISGSPNPTTATTAHNNVIRISSYELNSLGAQSIGTSFTANQEVSGTYSIPVWTAGWNVENLQVAVVIWSSTNADGISNSIIVDVN